MDRDRVATTALPKEPTNSVQGTRTSCGLNFPDFEPQALDLQDTGAKPCGAGGGKVLNSVNLFLRASGSTKRRNRAAGL